MRDPVSEGVQTSEGDWKDIGIGRRGVGWVNSPKGSLSELLLMGNY